VVLGFATLQQREAVIAMLTAVIHIADINFIHDTDTDGVYIENEEILEIGMRAVSVCLSRGWNQNATKMMTFMCL